MSHIVSIRTQVRDAAAAVAACQRLGLPPPVHRKVELFSAHAEGLAIELPDWHYRSSATSPRAKSSSTILVARGRARHDTSIVKSAGLGPKRRIQCPTSS